jgi:hypothetical protein
MIPYLALLFVVTGLAFVGKRSGDAARAPYIGMILLVLILFAGLRDVSVGTDTGTYRRQFETVYSVDDIWRTTEIGYNALMVLCAEISADYAVLLTAIALVAVSCYVAGIIRMTEHYDTALFLFVTMGAYTFFFNGARQGIAVSLCFLALPWLLDRRPMPYVLMVGAAALFHHTALVALPLYAFAKPRVSWRQLAFIGIGVVVVVVFLTVFVQLAADLLDDKYAAYAEEAEGGGALMTTFLVAQGIFLFFARKQMDNLDERYARLLNVYLIGLVPAIAAALSSINPSGLLRLHFYFSHAALILWPMLLGKLKKDPRNLLFIALVAVSVTFFVLTTTTFSNLAPYQLNPEFVL